MLLYNDVPMEVASELLGHSSIKITQENYGKVVKPLTSTVIKTVSWHLGNTHPMANNSTSKSWITIILELVEVFFKSSREGKTPRTWHQHVVPYEEGWAIRREGNKRITSKHRKQSTAINKAKTIARKHQADVIIHRADGTIRDHIGTD